MWRLLLTAGFVLASMQSTRAATISGENVVEASGNNVPVLRPMTDHPDIETAQSWSCQPRKSCPAIGSCEEAMWYLENCPWGGRLDRDNDGRPCESLC